MILSNQDITDLVSRGSLIIEPFDYTCVQPASYDVHLGETYSGWGLVEESKIVDPQQPVDHLMNPVRIPVGDSLVLMPGVHVLALIYERIVLPGWISAQVAGKSSLGRLGLAIHVTAGFVDPGWDGQLTLELVNQAPYPLKLYSGMLIGQVVFTQLNRTASLVYGDPQLGSKHQPTDEYPVPSQYYKNFEKSKIYPRMEKELVG